VEDEVANGRKVKKPSPLLVLTLASFVKRHLLKFHGKCCQFYRHILSARTLLAFVFVLFGKDKVDDVTLRMLQKIDDEERRTTLLLACGHMSSPTAA
jgi:hypothetical protein